MKMKSVCEYYLTDKEYYWILTKNSKGAKYE